MFFTGMWWNEELSRTEKSVKVGAVLIWLKHGILGVFYIFSQADICGSPVVLKKESLGKGANIVCDRAECKLQEGLSSSCASLPATGTSASGLSRRVLKGRCSGIRKGQMWAEMNKPSWSLCSPWLERSSFLLHRDTLLVLPYLLSWLICSGIKDFKWLLPENIQEDHLYFIVIWYLLRQKKNPFYSGEHFLSWGYIILRINHEGEKIKIHLNSCAILIF